MEYTQLLLFEEPLDVKVKNEVKKLKESNDRSRKAQFAKIGEVRKRCDDLEERLAILERGLCQATLQVIPRCDISSEKLEVSHEKIDFSPNPMHAPSRMYLFHQPSSH